MTFKKLTLRAAAALALAVFAAPALPCSDAKQTQAAITPATSVPAANTPKDAVAKQTPRPEKDKQQGKSSTATKRAATN